MVQETRVDDGKFAKIQANELEYWRTATVSPLKPWGFYDTAFAPYYRPFGLVIEAGCGPVPYILNPMVQADIRMVVDPLWPSYMKIDRYRHLARAVDAYYLKLEQAPEERFDAAFALNMLDHVQDLEMEIRNLHRVLKVCGDLYLFVDIGKRPDFMHPHQIDKDWLVERLGKDFQQIMVKDEKSWKFPNRILYYIGRKKTCDITS